MTGADVACVVGGGHPMLVAGSLYLAFVFSYLYLWTVAPQSWPDEHSPCPASCVAYRRRRAARHRLQRASSLRTRCFARRVPPSPLGDASAIALAWRRCWRGDRSHWQAGLRPDASGYAALVYLASALQLQIVCAIVIMGAYVLARLAAGRLHHARRVTFDSLALARLLRRRPGPAGPAARARLPEGGRMTARPRP